MTIPILSSAVFLAVSLYITFSILPRKNIQNYNYSFVYVFVFTIAIKLIISYFTVGFETDINLFKAWGDLCNRVGFNTVYYQTDTYLDYPPAYLYILTLIDNIKKALSLDYFNPAYTMLIKSPAIIADMLCGVFIYLLSKEKLGITKATILASIFMLNPLTIIDSSVWGQIDSICAFVLVVSLYLLNKNKFIPSGIVYGIGFLIKPQMMIFAPLYLIYTVVHKKYLGLIMGFLSAVVSIFLLALPFSRDFDFSFLIKCYKTTIGYYDYYTINAYNLFGLIGFNWKKLPDHSVLSSMLSFAAPVIGTLLTGYYMYFKKTKSSLYTAGALLMSTVYMFTVSMHERYLYPTMILILVAYIYNRDRRYLYSFISFTTISFINVAYILHLNNTFISPISFQILLLSALNLLTYFYFVYTVFTKKSNHEKQIELGKIFKNTAPLKEVIVDRKLYRKDYILIISITIFYAFFAFWNLGSRVTANTVWNPEMNESVVLEVSESYDTVLYLSGISTKENDEPRVGCNFTLEVSDDDVNYTAVEPLDQFSVYDWKETTLSQTGKYVRITANDSSTILNEIAFRNTAKKTISPVNLISGSDKITDEQGIVPVFPDYFDSTYFDEIYHARTAYEHILGVEPYENTHPPLGKLIISLCITIFGMNPFGWRFAGALFGVLMLPVFYHILKRLFGSSLLCACGTLIFAFDFMHFTQTRIATIDTYAVFFILLMYDAMLIFIQKDFAKSSFKSLLIPLAMSGLFMGLGIASKWTCAYGAVGLAVLLFGKLIVTYLQSDDKDFIFKKAFNICLWCLLFFVAIPFTIYFLSFLPMLLIPHNADNIFTNFINYQTHMFDYHSGLVAEHYFASPWYEWPFAIRNIWYFVTNNYEGTGLTSTISCLGNPVLWWTCLAGLIAVFLLFIRDRQQSFWFIIVGFLAVYLPWVLVPRLTFVYHYFTAVPFIIMALICIFFLISNKKISNSVLIGFTVLNLVMFVVFFPVISGYPATKDYIDFLSFMPNWYLA